MKSLVAGKRRNKRLNWNVVPLSVAKTYLGRLLERAAGGEAVFITRGREKFMLQIVPEIDPIPMRPPGYFASSYSAEDVKELNELGKHSIVRAPEDFE